MKKRLNKILWLVIAVCLIWIAYEAWQSWQIEQYNQAVKQQKWSVAAEQDNPHARFAEAFQLHQDDEFQKALVVYSRLQDDDDPHLKQSAIYNSGNAYFEQALAMAEAGNHDLVLPLVELAKQHYRQLLMLTPKHWQAKYNLERILRLYPDPEIKPVQEWQAPEQSPQAIVSMEVEAELP